MSETKDNSSEIKTSTLDQVSSKSELERAKATATKAVLEETRTALSKLKAEVKKGK